MNELSHCLTMASICGARALEDKERRAQWLGWAKVWNELAGEALGLPLENKFARRPGMTANAGAGKSPSVANDPGTAPPPMRTAIPLPADAPEPQ
jgi:hypothetical protein